MKTRTAYRTIQHPYTVYIAEDGKEFTEKAFCEHYENELKKPGLEQKYRSLVVKEVCPDCMGLYETSLFVCDLKDEADFTTVADWCRFCAYADIECLEKPASFPCRYVFSIDHNSYATTERADFLDWAKEILEVLEKSKGE